MRRSFLALVLVWAAAPGLGAVAEAHANYVRSNPASDARLVKPPAEVRIEFSEPPDPKGSEIQVLDTAGKRYDRNDVAPSGDPNGLKVSLDPIGDGGYIVAWTATSAVDGHTTKGNFAFVIGTGPPPLARMGPVAALADGGVLTIGHLAVDRPRRLIALAAGLSAALTATLVSHATAQGNLRDMALDFLHIVAVSVWTGGVVALLAIVLLPARDNTPEQRRALGGTVWRFSLTALVAVAVLLTAGVLQAFDRLVLIDDLYETPYGIALAVKIALVLVALAIGALNLLRYGPR